MYQKCIPVYKCISRNKSETAAVFLFGAFLSFDLGNGRKFNSIQDKESNRWATVAQSV